MCYISLLFPGPENRSIPPSSCQTDCCVRPQTVGTQWNVAKSESAVMLIQTIATGRQVLTRKLIHHSCQVSYGRHLVVDSTLILATSSCFVDKARPRPFPTPSPVCRHLPQTTFKRLWLHKNCSFEDVLLFKCPQILTPSSITPPLEPPDARTGP